jgi:hypothetical protein
MEKFKKFLTEAQVKELAAKFNRIGFGREIYGIKAPMFQKGTDFSLDIAKAIVDSLAMRGMKPQTTDIFAVTEGVTAKDITHGPMGNIVTPAQVAEDIKVKTGGGRVVLANPIYSRNRMAHMIVPFAAAVKELIIVLGLMEDEQGNTMIDRDSFWVNHKNKIDPTRLFTKNEVETMMGRPMVLAVTGKNYGDVYEAISPNVKVWYALDPAAAAALIEADAYVAGDVHSRFRTMNSLGQNKGGKRVLSMADFMNAPIKGSGFNDKFGLLGSNKLGDLIKLFPREEESKKFLHKIIAHIKEMTGVLIERALVFGDGAYKDPSEFIWELADPVVSPACIGLDGMPNEIKVKDRNEYYKSLGLTDIEAAAYTQFDIDNNKGQDLGTTPRRLKDLIGSLADLTAGSGDKGTPIVYFREY